MKVQKLESLFQSKQGQSEPILASLCPDPKISGMSDGDRDVAASAAYIGTGSDSAFTG